MRDYIILNGVNSNTITGLLISTLPPITKPKIRTQTEEIDGRDGDIVTTLGYSAYDKEIQIGLYGNFNINEVIAYFNTAGTVTFSNEPDKYYNYQIIDQIDYEKLIRFKTAKVKMHVQPFKYPLEETPVEINIQNVTGEGETISINNTAEAPVTLALKGNTSQDGTPTPTAPVEVNTVTGRQEINVVDKNLFDKNSLKIGYWYNNGETANAQLGYYKSYSFKAGETYYVSGTNAHLIIGCYNGTTRLSNIDVMYNNSFTIPVNTTDVYINSFLTGKDTTQIEKGLTATAYEPYQSQSYELDLGKNLFNEIYPDIVNETTKYISLYVGEGTFTMSSNAPLPPNDPYASLFFITGQATSGATTGGNGVYLNRPITIASTNGYVTIGYRIYGGINPEDYQTQVEKGDTATSYALYKTPIELCKIGTYQDYIYKDNNKWFIKRQIGKVIVNGSEEGWALRTSTSANYIKFRNNNLFPTNVKERLLLISNYFVANGGANDAEYSGNAICGNLGEYAKWLHVSIDNTIVNSVDTFKTWLGNNNVTVYYILATPTEEEITDATLIGQLNTIEANARSYDTTTNISQNTANKPFIINATAVKKGTDTGTVNNIGNIYAKPNIDIEGSGIVEIYLDGNQIFNVDLSTINECVIDTTNLEAYNPATTELMNRQVTGDYSNFKINVGDNQVKVSGAVTKATISNYTRWL